MGSFHILFQGFGMLAWHCNWEASRQANAFAKVCHQVPVDIAWVNPWEPHLAIATSSWCSAPSKVTHSASHLMVVPGSLPWHQRVSNAVAKAVLTFFERFIQNSQLLFKLPTPEPFSNCFFKPYLALPWNATLLEGVLFQEKPFFKDIPFSRESFLQWQGNPFSRLVTRKASVSVYLVMVSKSTFKPQAAECQCIHCSKLWCNMLLSSNTGSSTSSSSKPFFLHVSVLCPGRLLLPTVHTRADVNLVQGAQLYMYFPKPQGLP